jgi:4-aminobutyrate aminotransferase-like enzyme
MADAALERGLSFKVGGAVVCLCPPLTISDEVLEQALDSLNATQIASFDPMCPRADR